MSGSAPETRDLTLASGLPARVLVKGDGPPLVFLHNHLGLAWDAFLEALAGSYRVHAVRHPGCDDPDELMHFDAFSDLALFYDDVLAALGIEHATVVGHAFGGMAAAEFAAHQPARVGALVLIDALGLWLDEHPIPDISALPAPKSGAMLTGSDGLTQSLLAPPEDKAAAGSFMVARFLTQAAVSHFIWPIPDRDLARRLYRLTMPVLVVWGERDTYVPPVYADAFADGIKGARKVLIAGAGHMPHLESTDAVVAAIRDIA
jgi:pimeloyl-ACP methyl ester carboxylesterase